MKYVQNTATYMNIFTKEKTLEAFLYPKIKRKLAK